MVPRRASKFRSMELSNYLAPRFEIIFEELKKENQINYSGILCVRNSASTAVGKKRKHDEEQVEILNKLFA